MTRTLETAAAELAKQSFTEVTTEPEAYGVERPWRDVQEWIDFELDGDGPLALRQEFGVSFKEAASALTDAMRQLASLEQLNANLAESPDWS